MYICIVQKHWIKVNVSKLPKRSFHKGFIIGGQKTPINPPTPQGGPIFRHVSRATPRPASVKPGMVDPKKTLKNGWDAGWP